MSTGRSIPVQLGVCGALVSLGVIADCVGAGGAGTCLATWAIKAAGILGGGAAGNIVHDLFGRGQDAVQRRLRSESRHPQPRV